MTRTFGIITTAVALAALPAGAIAALSTTASPQSQISVAVGYGDLNLTNDGDVAKLTRRVRFAAQALCQSGVAYVPQKWRASRRCSEASFAKAAIHIRLAVTAARGPALAARQSGAIILVAR